MVKSNDLSTWSQLAKFDSLEQLLDAYKNPSQFQIELSELLQRYGSDFITPKVIEVGSANGVTSALLPDHYSRALLDFSPIALGQANTLFNHLGKKVELIEADILNPNLMDAQYDIVFSAGLLEHFSLKDRTTIVKNMFRLTSPNGYVLIAVPNHRSIPYRIGYLYQVLRATWLYPREELITHLKHETEPIHNSLYVDEYELSKDTVFRYLPATLNKPFRLLDKWLHFEAYLKVWVYQKGE